jgi:hypothetical protein
VHRRPGAARPHRHRHHARSQPARRPRRRCEFSRRGGCGRRLAAVGYPPAFLAYRARGALFDRPPSRCPNPIRSARDRAYAGIRDFLASSAGSTSRERASFVWPRAAKMIVRMQMMRGEWPCPVHWTLLRPSRESYAQCSLFVHSQLVCLS